MNNGANISACMEAVIADVADFRGYAYAKQPGGCTNAVNVPAGYLGVNVNGYINGNYCGQTGRFYNAVTSSYMSVGGAICGNPPGPQTFHTTAVSFFYKGPQGYPHNNGYKPYSHSSPHQTY